MCGLFGLAGPGVQQADIDVFIDMGIASQVRGRDAAGVFQTNTRAQGRHNHLEDGYKSVGTFLDMLDDIEISKKVHPTLLNSVIPDVFMGHVRARTRGRNIGANAHPFYTKTLVGMHNGTLVDVKYQHAEKTDSELMFQEMEYRGIIPTLTDLSENSAYAISVFERESRTLLFATNGKRPLWFVNLKDRPVMFWASEAAILRFALDRRGIAYHKPVPMPTYLLARLTPNKVTTKGDVSAWTKVSDIKKKEVVDKYPTYIHDAAKLLESSALIPIGEVASIETNNVLTFPAKDKEVVQKAVVVKRKNQRVPIKEFYTLKCKCGKNKLNFFQAKLCRRGEIGSPKYDANTDTFECKSCNEVKEEKKVTC